MFFTHLIFINYARKHAQYKSMKTKMCFRHLHQKTSNKFSKNTATGEGLKHCEGLSGRECVGCAFAR